MELAFFESLGNGTITIVQDTTIGDIACAHFGSGNGQFVIKINPNQMNLVSPPVQDFFLMHEYGHIYLKHLLDTNPNYRESEHYADAYGIRVLASVSNSIYANLAIDFFEKSGVPPDPTHPSHESRANYQLAVLSAYYSHPTVVPSPPPTIGTLLIFNPYAFPVVAYAQGGLLGSLDINQSGSVPAYGDPVFGDSYYIELYHYFSGAFLLGGYATVYAPGTTVWPGLGLTNGTLPRTSPLQGELLGAGWDYFAPGNDTGELVDWLPPDPTELLFRAESVR